ncbi:MAG: hypothetical protein RL150_72 [Candidatus Parcubacteria bacterium]|jgi:predicted Zn-ribbon and HTH transcriptional regulator
MQEKGQTLEEMAPFSDSFSLYLFKKTEKIVLALYLVTDHLSEDEPLRSTVRRIANEILKDGIKVTGRYVAPSSDDKMVAHLYETISFLRVAGVAKLVSMSNVDLIADEMQRLAKDIKSHQEASHSGANLRKSFFIVETPKAVDVFDKGHKGQNKDKMSFIKQVPTQASVSQASQPTDVNRQAQKDLRPVRDERSEKIFSIIKEKGQVTIKDVTEAFVGVSEKTIQRELQKLVVTGVLKRAGERRWSTYSVK